MTLPFHPWWHHPGHRYEGRHRGTYQWERWFPGRMVYKATEHVDLEFYQDLVAMNLAPRIPDTQTMRFHS